jgi:hypothetical protein
MRRRYRILIWVIGLSCVALVAAVALTVLAFMRKFYPEPPRPDFVTAHDRVIAQQQDLDYFKHYIELDQAYTAQARAGASRLLSEYRAQAGKLSQAQFDLAIARMAALADNGHSRVNYWRLARVHNRLPCRLYHFADGYRVIRARPTCRDLLGARILAMDGRPIEEVADSMFQYVGGPRNHYDQFASLFFLESPELLQAAGVTAASDHLVLHVALTDGSQSDVEIRADPADPHAPGEWASAYSDEYLSPERIEKETADWQPLLARDASLPVFLREYHVPFRSEYWPDRRMYYVQLRSNSDEKGHPLGEFLTHATQEIRTTHPHFIVLDLRLDQGGDLTKTASFMGTLTGLTASIEHVYLLISAWTFSAGESSAALTRGHGGAKVTVIGDPVGDRMRFWGEGRSLTLPNSGLDLHYATGLHDYKRSCWGESSCFWTLLIYPVRVSNLDPDIRVSYTFDDYASLRDPLLQKAFDLADHASSNP